MPRTIRRRRRVRAGTRVRLRRRNARKRRLPPRYKSGPKKGQFKPKAARKRRVKRNAPRKRVARKRVVRKRKATAKRKSPKRVAAGKKAARTRARKKAVRRAAAKKAARKRKRKPAARKRKTTTRKNPSTKRRKPVARKRRRRRKKTTTRRRRRSNPRRRRRMPPRIKSGPRKGQFKKRRSNPKQRRRRRRRNPAKGRVYYVRRKRGGRGKTRVRITRRRGRTAVVRANPFKAMKSALIGGLGIYGGVLGARVLTNVINEYVLKDWLAKQTGFMKDLAPIIPTLGTFALVTAVLPKIIKGKAKLHSALQVGATVALADAALKNLVLPRLKSATGDTAGDKVAAMLSGDFNISIPMAGYGEYLDYDNRLGEYTEDNRYSGFEVDEALAAGEEAYMQTGGAGGVFNQTVFEGVRGW